MSTLYFDKVFTRLPVQSEAQGSPHQHEADATMAENDDGIFNGFSYVSRKITYGKNVCGNSGSLKMGTKSPPSSSPPSFPSSPPRDVFGNNLNVLTHNSNTAKQSTKGITASNMNASAPPWSPSPPRSTENTIQRGFGAVSEALEKLPDGQKSLSSLAAEWDGPNEEDNRRGSDEMFDLDDMSL